MKYITNFFGVGCVALLAALILAPGAFAQQAPDPPTDLEARAGAVDETTGDQHGRITLYPGVQWLRLITEALLLLTTSLSSLRTQPTQRLGRWWP